MTHNIKRLVSSVLVVLIFLVPQSALGMESFWKGVKEDWNGLQRQVEVFFRKHADNPSDNPFTVCPLDVKVHILEQAAIARYGVRELRMVCKDWCNIINSINNHKVQIKQSIEVAIMQRFDIERSADAEIMRRFLNGRLIYNPNKDNSIGNIEMRIGDLPNPLDGTFDLSKCGRTGNHVSISTGYRKVKNPENAKKVEVWIAPRFLIERELSTTAKHFKLIMDSSKWDPEYEDMRKKECSEKSKAAGDNRYWREHAPVGLFWTWGGWDNADWYNHLTEENTDDLSKINLYKNWEKSTQTHYWHGGTCRCCFRDWWTCRCEVAGGSFIFRF